MVSEIEKIQVELVALLARVAELEDRWLAIPEEPRLAYPGLAILFAALKQ